MADPSEFNYDIKYLTNVPYYDINEAIEDYGFDFSDLLKDNFAGFLTDLITKYKNLRVSYIKRNLKDIRNYTHAFKSPLL